MKFEIRGQRPVQPEAPTLIWLEAERDDINVRFGENKWFLLKILANGHIQMYSGLEDSGIETIEGGRPIVEEWKATVVVY